MLMNQNQAYPMLMNQNQAYSCLWTGIKHTPLIWKKNQAYPAYETNQAYSCLWNKIMQTKQNQAQLILMSQNRHLSTTNIQYIIGDVIPFDLELPSQGQMLSAIFRKPIYDYLAHNDIYGTSCHWQWMEIHTWIFDRYIYILPWPILKVKVKVRHIGKINILEMATDRVKITIAIK